ncbi:hypothetical protein [Planctomyces sp. SH-PL14]|uniref:hypothetical protein n=1 Tax=Planctomyces sp. SH-PL14 TaxID=1632864 RepID=UPI0012E700AD|nr:hypothetical protein [Planctomyces sp. SH-PL14]
MDGSALAWTFRSSMCCVLFCSLAWDVPHPEGLPELVATMTQEANLSVAQSPDQAAAVAKFARELGAGFIELVKGTNLKVRAPFRFSVDPQPHGFRITPSERLEVDRDGVNPWLEYVDVYFDGRIVAGLHLIVSFEREV